MVAGLLYKMPYYRPIISSCYFFHNQMVWRSTQKVGCGIVSRDIYEGLMTFIVCRYFSAGNVAGFFLSNVMELRLGGIYTLIIVLSLLIGPNGRG